MDDFQAAPSDTSRTQQALKVLVKAYETYKELDETKEDEEEKLIGILGRMPLEQVVDPNSNQNNLVCLQIALRL